MAGTPDWISAQLGRYSIGERLRTLRLRNHIGLVELGKHTSLSAPLLSKLERGKLFPTLPTLMRIATVFGVGLDYFFIDGGKRTMVGIVRKGERARFPERPGAEDIPYHFECLDSRTNNHKLNAYLAEFQETAPEKVKPHQHPGVEFLFVLRGSLMLRIGSEEFQLEAEDAICFDCGVQHSYRRRGSKACTGVMVTVP